MNRITNNPNQVVIKNINGWLKAVRKTKEKWEVAIWDGPQSDVKRLVNQKGENAISPESCPLCIMTTKECGQVTCSKCVYTNMFKVRRRKGQAYTCTPLLRRVINFQDKRPVFTSLDTMERKLLNIKKRTTSSK